MPNWGSHTRTLFACTRGCLSQVESRRDLGLETSSWDFFQLRNVYMKCSYRMKMSVICCAVHFVEEGQHQRLHTARLGQGGRQSLHFTWNNSTATVEAPLTVPSYEEHIISLNCVNHTESMLWPIFVEAGSEPMLIEINKFVVIRHRDMKHEEANTIMQQATVPLTIFRSNSKFDQILQCSG